MRMDQVYSLDALRKRLRDNYDFLDDARRLSEENLWKKYHMSSHYVGIFLDDQRRTIRAIARKLRR